MILLQLIALKLGPTHMTLRRVSSHFQLMLIINLLFQSILELGTTKYAPTPNFAHISATKQRRTESFGTNIGPVLTHGCTNFQLKRSEPKADIVEKLENIVHELTDFNDPSVYAPNTSKKTIALCIIQQTHKTYSKYHILVSNTDISHHIW